MQATKYLQMVGKHGWKDTFEFYRADWKNWVGNAITGLVAAFSSPYLLWRFWGIETPNAMSNAIVTIIGGVIGFFAFMAILLVLNILIFTPAKLYYEKEKEVSRLTLDDINCEPHPFEIRGTKVIGLKIHNKKPIDIYDVEIQIAEIWHDGVKSDREFIGLSFGGADRFMSTFMRQLLASNKYDIVSVALIVGKQARIAIQPEIHMETDWSTGKEVIKKKEDRARYFILEPNEIYEVRIRMNAVIDRNYSAKAKMIFTGNLKFDGKNLALTKTT